MDFFFVEGRVPVTSQVNTGDAKCSELLKLVQPPERQGLSVLQ
jgi:hypothetical protein